MMSAILNSHFYYINVNIASARRLITRHMACCFYETRDERRIAREEIARGFHFPDFATATTRQRRLHPLYED